MTEKEVTSEPVPAVVGMAIMGTTGPGTFPPPSYSVIFPPYMARMPAAFATSSGEPPPNATMKSAPLLLYASTAFSTVSVLGFPSVSVNAALPIPAALRAARHLSTIPILFRCGPDMISALFFPSAFAASGSFPRLPFPKITCCGIEKENVSILLHRLNSEPQRKP